MAPEPPPRTSGGDGLFLPRDVLRKILQQLPASLLCRLRAVCRSWRTLLSDPDLIGPLFAVFVPDTYAKEADVLLLDASGRVVKRAMSCAGSSYPRFSSSQLRGHRGLVCFVGADERLRVLDPATGAVTVLPDLRKTLATFVLGRAASMSKGGEGGEYKVLSITNYGKPFCKVLTLAHGGGGGCVWRDAPAPPPDAIISSSHSQSPWRAAVAEGVVYLLAMASHSHPLKPAGCIVLFDLETEQWRPGLLQGPPSRTNAVESLAELDGRLVAVCGLASCAASKIDLWLLMGSGDGEPALWHKLCKVPVSRIRQGDLDHVHEPLWVIEGGRVAFWVWSPNVGCSDELRSRRRVLRVYDPRTDTCEEVARIPSSMEFGVGLYTGNLPRVQGTRDN
ncbi:hypothetical protein ACP70R_022798 [Stipagrostis hirtigluma subsp. patula]